MFEQEGGGGYNQNALYTYMKISENKEHYLKLL